MKYDQDIGAFERKAGHSQPNLDLALLADDHIQLRVSLCKPIQRLVIYEGRAEENDVIKPATEGVSELVDKKLCLVRVGRDVGGVHFSSAQIVTDCP